MKNKIIKTYQEALQNKDKYNNAYIEKLKDQAITMILDETCVLRKKYFIFTSYYKMLNKKNIAISIKAFKPSYKTFCKIENVSFDDFIDLQRTTYINEHLKSSGFRSYMHSLRQKFQTEGMTDVAIRSLLKSWFTNHLKIDDDVGEYLSSIKQKGVKRKYTIEHAAYANVAPEDRCNFSTKEIDSVLFTQEILQIQGCNTQMLPGRKKTMTPRQREFFIKNDIFFNRIASFFLLDKAKHQALIDLRKEYIKHFGNQKKD